MFQVLDFRSIVAAAINHLRSTQGDLTDFYVGSVTRTLTEASAIQVDEFYQRLVMGLLEAIPVAVYNAFGFEARAAVSATGFVRFTYESTPLSSVPIPAGTLVSWPDTRLRYVVSADSEIPAGFTYADIAVHAEFPGADGNAPAGAVTLLPDPIAGVSSVSNLDAIVGGADAETAAERKLRFIAYVGSLSRGTVWAVDYAARYAQVLDDSGHIVEQVTRVGIDEGAGQVDIYLYGSQGMASDALVAAAQLLLDGTIDPLSGVITPGYRAAGVRVTARPMNERPIAVLLRLVLLPGLEIGGPLYDAVFDAVRVQFAKVQSGGVLRVEQLTEAALTVDGVVRAVTTNTVNEACSTREVLILGELILEQIDV